MPILYDELRRLANSHMARERRDHTLLPTALVHEAYVRLVDQDRVNIRSKAHFMALASKQMRRVLIDHERRRTTKKRGGGTPRVTLSGALVTPADQVAMLDLEEALHELAELDKRQARLVELRFFGGLTVEDAASSLEIALPTAERDWRMARAWLFRRLGKDRDSASP